MAAVMQHITYNEFLPMVLGKEAMLRHDLVLLKDGYSSSYDQYTNPSIANGFATAAFRYLIISHFVSKDLVKYFLILY